MASILLRNQLIDGAARKATPAGLPTVITVDVGGKSKDVPVAYFWKDAIATGEYQHPKTGQKLSIDGARLDGLVSKFHEMKAAGVEIPDADRPFVQRPRQHRVRGRRQARRRPVVALASSHRGKERRSCVGEPVFAVHRSRVQR
jgi:hypothetical protein